MRARMRTEGLHIHLSDTGRNAMRLDRVPNMQEYQAFSRKRTGLHVLTNTCFQDGCPEALRLNLQSPNTGYRRANGSPGTFPRESSPFDILSPSLLLSADQLGLWHSNFAVVSEAVGNKPLGTIRVKDPANDSILRHLQARSFEIAYIDTLMETLPVETALYQAYNRHGKTIGLLHGDTVTVEGASLLRDFESAAAVYCQVPELCRYFVQEDIRTEELGPRGQRFREWLSGSHTLPIGQEAALEYIGYELRPLHLAGRDFRWKQTAGDLRLVAVDLLCRYQDQPVWCEVKMAGDTWTSSALLQILFYGCMVSSGHQRRRLNRFFPNQFNSCRPWLGILVEKRDDPDFCRDWDQTIAFARHPSSKQVLQPHFDGIIFVLLTQEEEGWGMADSTVVRW